MPLTVSRTSQKQRLWVPSPNTVIGSPATACRTNRGTTIPYRPVWRGPIVLKSRTTVLDTPYWRW